MYNLLLSAERFKTKDSQTSISPTTKESPNCVCILIPTHAENSNSSPFRHSTCHRAAICSLGSTLGRAGLSSMDGMEGSRCPI